MVIVISVLHQWVRHIDFVFIENIFDFHSIKTKFCRFFSLSMNTLYAALYGIHTSHLIYINTNDLIKII